MEQYHQTGRVYPHKQTLNSLLTKVNLKNVFQVMPNRNPNMEEVMMGKKMANNVVESTVYKIIIHLICDDQKQDTDLRRNRKYEQIYNLIRRLNQ